MRRYLEILKKTPMFFVFVFAGLFYGLSALGLQAEINRYAIVTAVGIDKVDQETEGEGNSVEVSLLTFVPIADQTFKETYKVISAQGRNISEAIDYAGLHIGREVGLSHVKLVVVNDKLLEEDVSSYLDYLSRSETIAPTTKLIATDASAKDFLDAAQKLDSQSSIKVSDLIVFNDDYVYATDSSFENFYKGRLGPTKVSLMPYLKVDTQDAKGIQVFADQQTQGKSGGSQQEEKKEISNNGETLVLKNAMKKVVLDGRDVKKINLIKGDFRTGSIEIGDIDDEKFKNAEITFEILDQKVKYKVIFQNGFPIVNISNEISLTLAEIRSEGKVVEDNVEYFDFSQKIKDAIKKKVRSSMMEAIEIMRDNQVDIADFYTEIFNADKKQFLQFLNRLEDEEDYLNHVIFKVGVRIVTK